MSKAGVYLNAFSHFISKATLYYPPCYYPSKCSKDAFKYVEHKAAASNCWTDPRQCCATHSLYFHVVSNVYVDGSPMPFTEALPNNSSYNTFAGNITYFVVQVSEIFLAPSAAGWLQVESFSKYDTKCADDNFYLSFLQSAMPLFRSRNFILHLFYAPNNVVGFQTMLCYRDRV